MSGSVVATGVWRFRENKPVPSDGEVATNGPDLLALSLIDANGDDRSAELTGAVDGYIGIETPGDTAVFIVEAVVPAVGYVELVGTWDGDPPASPGMGELVTLTWETVVPVPTPDDETRVIQAVVAKATRILMLAETPLGVWGEISELGAAVVRPDYGIRETLFGLRYLEWPNLAAVLAAVTPEMVIRQGLQTDPDTFPSDRLPDVERAIAAARSWVTADLEGVGVA